MTSLSFSEVKSVEMTEQQEKELQNIADVGRTTAIVFLTYIVFTMAIFIWTVIGLATFNVPQNTFTLALVLLILFSAVPGLNIVPLVILYMNKK